ncbi:methylated-DNA--[protein]-cysteine S-methyltransferase [candidate division NPL-UPA2 bacterium]|nr:methylated-DNA--[protein]-cysteine S-methyltransferase [candidate division NPL-UPA2 bacterium]
MKNSEGEAIYVGKARSLKKRVRSYFQSPAARTAGRAGSLSADRRDLTGRAERLRSNIADLEYIITDSEVEALILECNLIKEHRPRYNVRLRDDKKYPFVKLTNEDYPCLFMTRNLKDDGSKYYGPYTNVKMLRKTMKSMRELFPLRSCQRKIGSSLDRPCLNYDLKQCVAPCSGRVGKEEYQNLVKSACLFLEGRRQELIKELKRRMETASRHLRFEEAGRWRDKITAIERITEKQKIAVWERRERKPLEMVRSNARVRVEGLGTEAKSRRRDKEEAAAELQRLLHLPSPPRRIEAFDVSSISGKEAVGSMVVFEEASPKKKEYRHFKIKLPRIIDDYAMIREIVRRRYQRVLAERRRLPDLVVIDGGRGHLNSALNILIDLGLEKVPVMAIAKKLEHIFIKERSQPIILSSNSALLRLIQAIRDEAHRFAIKFHRHLRQKKLREYTPFQHRVWEVVKTIPSGQTRSYQWVAEKVGSPKAARAVGQALKKNPLPGVIPCHRVIRSNGSLGGFSQGRKRKRSLLLSEGVR